MKFRIIVAPAGHNCEVYLDGRFVKNCVGFEVGADVNGLSQLTLRLHAVDVELEGESAVLIDKTAIGDQQTSYAQPAIPATSDCSHPEDHRTSFAAPGSADFFCKACGQMVHRPLVETT